MRFLIVGLAFVSLVVPAYVPVARRGVRLPPDPGLALAGAVLGVSALLAAALFASRDTTAFSRRLRVSSRAVALAAAGVVAGFFLRLGPAGTAYAAVLVLFAASVAAAFLLPEASVPTPEEARAERARAKAEGAEAEAAVQAAIERGRARQAASPDTPRPVERAPVAAADAATCSRCGKTGTPLRTDKSLVVGTFDDFADVIMRCPACGRLYCGSCSLVARGGSGEYVCHVCGEPLGPV